jgi:hypothetical protein
MQFFEIQTNPVAHIDMLQMSPRPLGWIQIRRIWRQHRQVNIFSGGGDKFLHLQSPMDGGSDPRSPAVVCLLSAANARETSRYAGR